jgi:hypothetical protein
MTAMAYKKKNYDLIAVKQNLNFPRHLHKMLQVPMALNKFSLSKYAEDVRMEPPGADEAVREVKDTTNPTTNPAAAPILDSLLSVCGLLCSRIVVLLPQSSNGGPQSPLLPAKFDAGNLDRDKGINPDNRLSEH